MGVDISQRRPGACSPETKALGLMKDDERQHNELSCPAHAGHPVITNVSDYWIARWSLSSGRPKAGPVGGR
jgi:hypothetical protein